MESDLNKEQFSPLKHLPSHKSGPKAEQPGCLIGLENENWTHWEQEALGNTPVILQQKKLKKGNTKESSSGRRKIIPDGDMEKQKGLKSNSKSG